jgi:hypothetical protein
MTIFRLLYLEYNSLIIIPDTIGWLTKLEHLYLRKNLLPYYINMEYIKNKLHKSVYTTLNRTKNDNNNLEKYFFQIQISDNKQLIKLIFKFLF